MSVPGDQVAMDVDGVEGAGHGLVNTASAARSSWQQAKGQAEGLAGQLGKGPMGENFMDAFHRGLDGVDADAIDSCERLRVAGVQVVGSAGDYRAADANGANSMPKGE